MKKNLENLLGTIITLVIIFVGITAALFVAFAVYFELKGVIIEWYDILYGSAKASGSLLIAMLALLGLDTLFAEIKASNE